MELIIKILIGIICLMTLLIFVASIILIKKELDKKQKGGILTTYQNDDSLKINIDICTNIYLGLPVSVTKEYNDTVYESVLDYIYNVHKIVYSKNEDLVLKIGFTISLIEIYFVLIYYNNMYKDNPISYEIKDYINSGSYNIVLLTEDNHVLRISNNEYTYDKDLSISKYNNLKQLAKVFESKAKNNLPKLIYSSINIIPAELYFNSNSFINLWFIEKQYERFTTYKQVNLIKYINLIINVSKYARMYGLMFTDWKVDNIMYDFIDGHYVLTDFDFRKIRDENLKNEIPGKPHGYNLITIYSYKDNKYLYDAIYNVVENNINNVLLKRRKNKNKMIVTGNINFDINVETNRIYALFVGLYDVINIYTVTAQMNKKYVPENTTLKWFFSNNAKIKEYVEKFKNRLIRSGLITINLYNDILTYIGNLINQDKTK